MMTIDAALSAERKEVMTTEQDRIDRLERLLDKLCFAIERRGSEQDGGWGWPSFVDEVREIRGHLAEQDATLSMVRKEG